MDEGGRLPESVIGYVLIGGLIVSILAETLGIATYYAQSGGFNFDFSSQWQMAGPDFFSYSYELLGSAGIFEAPIALMALGVVLLMLTSYLRVFATMLHFAFARNWRYTGISLFLFAVLTITLLVH